MLCSCFFNFLSKLMLAAKCVWFVCEVNESCLLHNKYNLDKTVHNLQLASTVMGAQWLSGRVLDSRPRGRGFEPNWRHCLVVL